MVFKIVAFFFCASVKLNNCYNIEREVFTWPMWKYCGWYIQNL